MYTISLDRRPAEIAQTGFEWNFASECCSKSNDCGAMEPCAVSFVARDHLWCPLCIGAFWPNRLADPKNMAKRTSRGGNLAHIGCCRPRPL